jgi:UDP-N-acetylglucosamine--N-acetylmuramyl-(pentapeptide) pyrophosphoryl-undecaprenol N-acetylglucosamine transferase
VGPANTVVVPAGDPPYVVAPYVDEMQYAYAAADLALCRSGAMTCAELTAVGLPAVYVPLPLRGGEQRYNAEPIVAAGGGVMIDNAQLTADRVVATVLPLLTDPLRLAAMSQAAERSGARDADVVLARHVLAVVDEHRRFGRVR